MGTSLVELSSEALHVESLIAKAYAETGGEVTTHTDELEAYMADIAANITTKAENVFRVMTHLEERALSMRNMATQYTDASCALNANRDRLKALVKFVMEQQDIKELKGETMRFQLNNTTPSLDVDQEQLPEDWWKTVITRLPDNARIKDALKNDIKIEGARLVFNKALRSYVGGGSK